MTDNGQNARMRAASHRAIIYGERSDGEGVTEEELRGLIMTLESKGFKSYYLRESPHRLMEVFHEWKRLLTQ